MSSSVGAPFDRCVACGSDSIVQWRTKRFQYTAGTASYEFRIYRCGICGTGFLNPPPHTEWFRETYKYSAQALTAPVTLAEILERERRCPNVTIDANRMATFTRSIDKTSNGRALDVGSGFGFYTKSLKEQAYDTISINPAEYGNTVFYELHGEHPMPIMFDEFQDPGQFGAILMSQVLEHIVEPRRAVEKVASLLTTGGVLACAVPNFRSLSVRLFGTRDNACLWVPEHVNYFSTEGLTTLLERHGLNVVKVEQVTRIPCDAVRRRLKIEGRVGTLLDRLVRVSQSDMARLLHTLDMGLYINMYAVQS
jgi:SAM-dependent methyltransferase